MTPSSALRTQLDFIQRGGRVNRMHMIPTIHPQNVAAHSFGVAWWCWLLLDGAISVNLLMAALSHDLSEGATGDIPEPTKRMLLIGENLKHVESRLMKAAHIPLFELTQQEHVILKTADALELLQHCIRERKIGNRTEELYEMYGNVSRIVRTTIPDSCFFAFRELSTQWEEANGS